MNRNTRWALGVGAATLVITVIWLVPVLAKFDGDALRLAVIGTKFSEGLPEDHPDHTVGYDGQFAYYIARYGFDPPHDYTFDSAPYRYQRILYPALSALLSLGRAAWLPWALLGVNVVAHSVGAGLLAYLLAKLAGRPRYALYALVYSVWVGEMFAVHFDLNEPLAMALGLAGIVLYHHERGWWAALCFALSALTKDIGVVMMAGAAMHAWFAGRRREFWLLGGSTVGAYVGWMAALRFLLGSSMLDNPMPPRLSPVPLIGLAGVRGLSAGEALGIVELAMISAWLVIPALVWGYMALRSLRRDRAVLSAWLVVFGALFVVFLPKETYFDFAATMRVGVPAIAAILLYGAQRHPKRLPIMVIVWLPSLLTAALLPGFQVG